MHATRQQAETYLTAGVQRNNFTVQNCCNGPKSFSEFSQFRPTMRHVSLVTAFDPNAFPIPIVQSSDAVPFVCKSVIFRIVRHSEGQCEHGLHMQRHGAGTLVNVLLVPHQMPNLTYHAIQSGCSFLSMAAARLLA